MLDLFDLAYCVLNNYISNMSQLTFSQDDANNIIRYIFDEATIRPDGMVNITALASAYFRATGKRKDTNDWLRTTRATAAITYLERVTGIPVSQLVIAEHGVGTWVHPKLAEMYAQWCSIEYEFAVVDLIQAAKTQKVELAQPKTALELAKEQVPCPRYQTKNLYHHSAWRLAYSEVSLPETTTLLIKF
jgi:hypothetical protein